MMIVKILVYRFNNYDDSDDDDDDDTVDSDRGVNIY